MFADGRSCQFPRVRFIVWRNQMNRRKKETEEKKGAWEGTGERDGKKRK